MYEVKRYIIYLINNPGFTHQGPYCFIKIIINNHNCIVRDFLNEPIPFWLHI